MKVLFKRAEYNDTDAEMEEVFNWLKDDFDWDGNYFPDLEDKSKFSKQVKLFDKLQRFNDENKLKNFALIPMYQDGRHHIMIDTHGFKQLLSHWIKGDEMRKLYNTPKEKMDWTPYFDYKKLETENKKFEKFIRTDGIAISFGMEHQNRFVIDKKEAKKAKKGK